MGVSGALVAVLLVCCTAVGFAQDDIAVVKERLIESEFTSDPEQLSSLTAEARAFAAQLQVDGDWADVDYKNQSPSDWRTLTHLDRVRTMAIAHQSVGSELYGDTELLGKISSALDYWIQQDFHNPNWWYNEIGAQRTLGPIALLLDDHLSEKQREAIVSLMKRTVWKRWAGQNLIWGVSIQVMRGCVEKNAEVVREAFDRMAEEIRIATDAEGIQPDFSFHQHGKCLYTGGYGRGFAEDCARFAYYASGTSFAFPSEKIDLLSRYILDGVQWMMRGSILDYGSIGREITRKGHSGRAIAEACRHMSRIDAKRSKEFSAFEKRIRGNTLSDAAILSGNRHFFRSDMMTHHRKAFYASARMISNRLENTDIPCNNEGRTSHHLADGATFFMRTGREYVDIFPVWDWRKVPGTTVEYYTKPLDVKTVRSRGTRPFVGGVSDGKYGLAAMDFARGSLTARKSYFFFDREVVCLGAGISSDSDLPVVTSVDQCLLNGPVVMSDGNNRIELKQGERKANVVWVHHDSTGYIFPGDADVHIKNDVQTGSWADIGAGSPDKVEIDVFSLWINHGTHALSSDYAYIVVSEISAEDLDSVASSDLAILSNTPKLQAVQSTSSGILQAAFYAAGSLEAGANLVVSVDQPCLLLVRETGDTLTVAASNPENKALSLVVEISRKLSGQGCEWQRQRGTTRIKIELPGGVQAGSSVVRHLKPDILE